MSDVSEFHAQTVSRHVDGSPLFKTAGDRVREKEVAAALATQWHCELHPFGQLAPIDWFAVRDGRVVGLIELKARSHASDRFPTVFLSVRKWLALIMAENGMGVPAVFVVQFTDGIRWIRVADVSAKQVRMGGVGFERDVKFHSAVEPMIDVPVSAMRCLDSEEPHAD